MADQEHGFESPEGHRLCVNNCGFLGSPATQNMCSKCYRDILKHGSVEAVEPTRQTTTSASLKPVEEDASEGPLTSSAKARPAAVTAPPAAVTGRCATCRKRVGLTGFRCRCGTTFCGVHRYPEKHGCTFDYKAVGKEALAKENPVVKAAKLHYKI